MPELPKKGVPMNSFYDYKTEEFDKDELEEIVGFNNIAGMELISDEITDQGRWDTHHEVIFSYKNKYYMTTYSRGSTEQQDHGYEWTDIDKAKGLVGCTEVEPYEVKVTKYRAVPKD